MTHSDNKKRVHDNTLPSKAGRRLMCEVRIIPLENGETVKRGCGRTGMMPSEVGWSCFYCGNYVYRPDPPISALWFHFKVAISAIVALASCKVVPDSILT